jgi:hypothetical protein
MRKDGTGDLIARTITLDVGDGAIRLVAHSREGTIGLETNDTCVN